MIVRKISSNKSITKIILTLDPRERPRAEIRLRRSSRSRLLSGDTLINDDKLEDTPRLSPPFASLSLNSPALPSSCV